MRRGMAAVMAMLVPAAWAPAWAAECRMPGHEGPPRVEVVASMVPPLYRHDRSKKRLSSSNPALRQGQSEAGLTSARTEISIRPKVWFAPHRTGGSGCAAVESVVVDWRISVLVVDIASDYREGSCPYRAILDHENEHVRITQGAFQRATVELRRRLAQAVQAFARPVVLSVPPGGEAREVAARLQAALNPVTRSYEAEARRLNAGIDTPASYARVQARCRDW